MVHKRSTNQIYNQEQLSFDEVIPGYDRKQHTSMHNYFLHSSSLLFWNKNEEIFHQSNSMHMTIWGRSIAYVLWIIYTWKSDGWTGLHDMDKSGSYYSNGAAMMTAGRAIAQLSAGGRTKKNSTRILGLRVCNVTCMLGKNQVGSWIWSPFLLVFTALCHAHFHAARIQIGSRANRRMRWGRN